MLAGAQHCVPQPAAQGHPVAWSAGALLPFAAPWQRLKSGEGPAATDSGNSSACRAMT